MHTFEISTTKRLNPKRLIDVSCVVTLFVFFFHFAADDALKLALLIGQEHFLS